jgi:hypothetical protein
MHGDHGMPTPGPYDMVIAMGRQNTPNSQFLELKEGKGVFKALGVIM